MVSTWTLILRSEVFADDVVFVRIERERERESIGRRDCMHFMGKVLSVISERKASKPSRQI